jgi:tRNA pseudouridine55 synthase
MNGMLLVDKPYGWTSFDVVNYIRKIIATSEGKKPKQVKVGHTGTLDPLATGLLVVLVGVYTKRAQELTKRNKMYEVTMKLGETSTTGDEEGEKQTKSDRQPTHSEIAAALQMYTGDLLQTPPAYSAVKIHGQRAYKLAREGKSVQLEARPVIIYRNELSEYEYPYVHFVTEVSSGTFVRSLVDDIGKTLQTGAYLSKLYRTQVGEFNIENAASVENLSSEEIYRRLLLDS